jgi:hypothetical protein
MAKDPFGDDLHPFDIPLMGKFRNDVDPMFLGNGDYQDLENLRYNLTGLEAIGGMTSVGSFASKPLTGFQYKKTNPDESHTFVQSGSEVYKSDNTSSIPVADTYSSFLFVTSDTVNMGTSPDDAVVICDGTDNYIWRGAESRVGLFAITDALDFYVRGTAWKDYTAEVNNALQTAGNYATTFLSSTTHTRIVIGAYLPIQGITLYLKTPSTVSGTLSLYQRTGEGTAGLTVPLTASDGTAGLTASGKITFTAAYPKPTIVNNVMAFYYLLDFVGADSGVEIYRCTLDAPVQPIQDIFDGVPVTPLSCLVYNGSEYYDRTLNVSGSSAYVGASDITYMKLDSTPPENTLYVGFDREMTALMFDLPDGDAVNGNASTINTFKYYNGTAWVSVGSINDGTYSSPYTMRQTGTVSWVPPARGSESMTSLFNTVRLFYYAIVFSAEFTSHVHVHQISGIPAQAEVNPYKFPLFWQNRLLLCNDTSDRQNNINVTSSNSPQVMNGEDSAIVPIGDGQPLVAGATLFTRYGGSLYDNAILFKQNSVHLIDGGSLSDWRDYTVAESVGCIAPKTLQKCDMGYEIAPGITKHVLLWMSARGIEFFDGNTLSLVSEDLRDYFKPKSASYINTSIANQFSSFYDDRNNEYHIMFATGSSTTLNQEWVYDLAQKKWYPAVRGSTGKSLTCGFSVLDSTGFQYNYCGTVDGTLERMEYGTDFDGNSMTFMFQTGDMGLEKSLMNVTSIRHLKFIARCKTTSAATVKITHYADGATTGFDLPLFSQKKAGYRVYQMKQSLANQITTQLDGVLHSFKVTVTTDDETVGFEPLYLGGLFKIIRRDV